MLSPYAQHVGDRDPVAVLRTSLEGYQDTIRCLTPAKWQQPWAPEKWTVEQIMVHVAQWEMILGIRLRCGVAVLAAISARSKSWGRRARAEAAWM